MTQKKYLKLILIGGLALLSLGGWLLHLRIHTPAVENVQNFIPFIAGLIGIIVLPVMFYFSRALSYAYALNGLIVIIGTITMTHFSLEKFIGELTISTFFLNTTFADIAVLWGKFVLGKAIFELELLKTDNDMLRKGRFFRYPNMGWWWVHLLAITLVYAAGHWLFEAVARGIKNYYF